MEFKPVYTAAAVQAADGKPFLFCVWRDFCANLLCSQNLLMLSRLLQIIVPVNSGNMSGFQLGQNLRRGA